MLWSRLCFGGVASVLLVWACGSDNSTKQVRGEAGAGGMPDAAAGEGPTPQAGHAGKAGGGSAGGGSGPMPAMGGAGQGGEAGAEPLGGTAGSPGLGGASGANEGGTAGATEGGAGGAPTCDQEPTLCGDGYVCSNHECVNVAGSLSGLLWELPCGNDLSSVVCAVMPTTTVQTQLGGAQGVTYDVKLHFRGVVEQKTYTGGCTDGSYWLTGGSVPNDGYNVYRLTVSSPPQTFYLNRGASSITNVWALDLTQTIRIDAGATVTLFADTVDSQEIKNVDGVGMPVSVSNVSVAQPYNGQFIQMDVEGVTPDVVASGATVGSGSAGSALSFSGGQLLTVADAASLAAVNVTQEAWFNFAAPSGSYSSLFGKTYGNQSQDSYTMWFQDGGLHAGVGASSPNGTPSVPFTTYGEWHHAALTYDSMAQVQTLYVDGLPVSCTTSTGAVPYDTHPLLIGADIDYAATQGFWNGQLDEVRLFSVARTPSQVWADMHTHALGPSDGLVGEWTFDEGMGQTSADSSGNGNGAVLGSSAAAEGSDPSWVTSTVPH